MTRGITSDLKAALECNYPTFSLKNIVNVVADIPGENDEYDWWWILSIRGRGYLLLSGGCDYTGWDCGSSIEEHGFFKTKLEAAMAAPEEDDSRSLRAIRSELVSQVKTGHTFSLPVTNYGS